VHDCLPDSGIVSNPDFAQAHRQQIGRRAEDGEAAVSHCAIETVKRIDVVAC
jgi:hypothetical protein